MMRGPKMYIVARSLKTRRPMCQHIVNDVKNNMIVTSCGRVISGRSSEYTDMALRSIMCQQCESKEE